MKALFTLPDGFSFIIDMETIPRKGDGIFLGDLSKKDFDDKEDYDRFSEQEYGFQQWIVDSISWSLKAKESHVSIFLSEIASA